MLESTDSGSELPQPPSGSGPGGGGRRKRKRKAEKGNSGPVPTTRGRAASGKRANPKVKARLQSKESAATTPSLITEDIDVNAQAGDATCKDDLMLLAAGPDGAQWAEELGKLLQAEQKGRNEMLKHRVTRVHHWQQTVESSTP